MTFILSFKLYNNPWGTYYYYLHFINEETKHRELKYLPKLGKQHRWDSKPARTAVQTVLSTSFSAFPNLFLAKLWSGQVVASIPPSLPPVPFASFLKKGGVVEKYGFFSQSDLGSDRSTLFKKTLMSGDLLLLNYFIHIGFFGYYSVCWI